MGCSPTLPRTPCGSAPRRTARASTHTSSSCETCRAFRGCRRRSRRPSRVPSRRSFNFFNSCTATRSSTRSTTGHSAWHTTWHAARHTTGHATWGVQFLYDWVGDRLKFLLLVFELVLLGSLIAVKPLHNLLSFVDNSLSVFI